MAKGKISVLIFLLTAAIIVTGFLFLLRGCLSQYDTRFAMPPVLYFGSNDKNIVFSIVQYQKTTSYSSRGGVTNRGVNVEYYVQCNDAFTGSKIKDAEVAEHRDLTQYPVEVLGASHNKAWVFIGQVMAFDPFTLEKIVDTSTIRQNNPQLNAKLPAERAYYVFDRASGNIVITAKDGTKWKLDTGTLKASAIDENEPGSQLEEQVKYLEAIAEKYSAQYDSLGFQTGPVGTKVFFEKQRYLRQKQDSIKDIIHKLEDEQRNRESIQREIETLNRNGISFPQMKVNSDTANGVWFGIYSPKEMEKLYDRIDHRSEYDETARRKFYVSTYASGSNDLMIDKKNVKAVSSELFLHGGFLLDKSTALPVRLNGSYLVIHRDQVGRDGKILLSMMSTDGKVSWMCNTQLKEWMDWIYTRKQLIVLGMDDKSLSGYECNILLCIDLANGKIVKYDFMQEK